MPEKLEKETNDNSDEFSRLLENESLKSKSSDQEIYRLHVGIGIYWWHKHEMTAKPINERSKTGRTRRIAVFRPDSYREPSPAIESQSL